jgi:hypothetical protein
MVSMNVPFIKPVGAGCLEDRQVDAGLTVLHVLSGVRWRGRRRGYLA